MTNAGVDRAASRGELTEQMLGLLLEATSKQLARHSGLTLTQLVCQHHGVLGAREARLDTEIVAERGLAAERRVAETDGAGRHARTDQRPRSSDDFGERALREHCARDEACARVLEGDGEARFAALEAEPLAVTPQSLVSKAARECLTQVGAGREDQPREPIRGFIVRCRQGKPQTGCAEFSGNVLDDCVHHGIRKLRGVRRERRTRQPRSAVRRSWIDAALLEQHECPPHVAGSDAALWRALFHATFAPRRGARGLAFWRLLLRAAAEFACTNSGMAFLRLVVVWLAALGETIAARVRRGPLRPGWGLTFEWVIRALRRDMLGMSGWSYPRLRKELDWRFYPKENLRKLRVTREVIAGVPGAWFEPPQVARGGLILYLHGGSYIFGSVLTTHADLIARLAMDSGARTLGIDYRLAPEHAYPAALEDTLAVIEELVRRGTPASELVLVGDSAGANLALAVQIALRERGLGQAHAAALISPWLELNASFASCRVNDAYDYGQTSFLLPHAHVFAGALPLDDPRISPLHADLTGLSPLFVQVGSAERLFDEGVELVLRAEHAGVSATLDVAREMPHNPPVLAALHPEAARALRALVDFASHHLVSS